MKLAAAMPLLCVCLVVGSKPALAMSRRRSQPTITSVRGSSLSHSGTSAGLQAEGEEGYSSNRENVESPTESDTSASDPKSRTGTFSKSGSSTSASSSSGVTSTDAHTDQKTAQTDTAAANQQGSAYSSSLGVLSCAEGANTIQENLATSGVLIGSCLDSFTAASMMKNSEVQASGNADQKASTDLTVQPSVMNSSSGKAIMADFEEKYGVSKDGFASMLLKAKGNPDVLSQPGSLEDFFGGKITNEKVEQALAAADALDAEERARLLSESRVAEASGAYDLGQAKNVAAASAPPSLREALRSRIKAERGAQRAPASETVASAAPAADPKIEVMNPEKELGLSSPETAELTIFDVVHSKYSDVSRRFR